MFISGLDSDVDRGDEGNADYEFYSFANMYSAFRSGL